MNPVLVGCQRNQETITNLSRCEALKVFLASTFIYEFLDHPHRDAPVPEALLPVVILTVHTIGLFLVSRYIFDAVSLGGTAVTHSLVPLSASVDHLFRSLKYVKASPEKKIFLVEYGDEKVP